MMKEASDKRSPRATPGRNSRSLHAGTGEGRRARFGPYKARKGAGLVLALMVVLVGGLFVVVTFDFVAQFSGLSVEQRGIYVDHTTALSVIQAKIAQIIESNRSAGRTQHVSALGYDGGGVPGNGSLDLLDLDDLRFGAPWSESVQMSNGTGLQRVDTEVFDMHFMPEWVDYDSFSGNPDQMRDFPPVFNMAGEVGGGGTSALGDHSAPGAGTSVSGGGTDELNPDSYGAYLIRVRLYDLQGKLLRTAEEVFVQILP
jgi:hypothetical protein